MSPSVKFINTKQARKTMCNMTYKEDLVYQAHSLDLVGRTAYVTKEYADTLLEALRMVHKTSNPEHATDILKTLGEI